MPSTFVWYSRVRFAFRVSSGSEGLADVDRLPGASISSAIQLRPSDGISVTCCGSMLPPRLEVATSSSGDSAVTVTVSCTRGRVPSAG